MGSALESRDHTEETWFLPTRLKGNYNGLLWNIAFSTNSHGFRDTPPLNPVPEPGEFRILSLGDSIGFGLGIPPHARYSEILEKALSRSTKNLKIHVVNASGQGYSPSGYGVYLRHEGLKLNPHLVLVQIELCNDVTDESLLHWSLPKEFGLPNSVRGGRYIVAWDGNLLGSYALGPYLFEKTYIYTTLLRKTLETLYRIHPTEPFHSTREITYYVIGFEKFLLDQERVESGWQRLFLALEGIHKLLESRDIPFLVLLVPSRFVFQKEAPNHALFARKLVDRAAQESLSREIPLVDLSTTLSQAGGSDLYFDFAHLTNQGNRVVGEALAREIQQREITGKNLEFH